jgi:uncharacterized protein (TIGR02646 family)
MIPIMRGDEPPELGIVRQTKLEQLRNLGRAIVSDDIDGYRVVSCQLWKVQHFKCCYCEHKVTMRYNDVEHYRPKARADRRPGCTRPDGYWWLAYSWQNLLYACATCNRSSKNDSFPLEIGSVSLVAETVPPGGERPLLLDPASQINPVDHIQYVQGTIGGSQNVSYWWARPRGASELGRVTIEVCDLNNVELRELRNDHYMNYVVPQIAALNAAIGDRDRIRVKREFIRAGGLLRPECTYVALSYDALTAAVSGNELNALIGEFWPSPSSVGRYYSVQQPLSDNGGDRMADGIAG